MTPFWFIVAGMLLLALTILIWPFVRNKSLIQVDASGRNVNIARQQLKELKLQLQDGLLNQVQFDAQYVELLISFRNDLETDTLAPTEISRGRWVIPLLFIFIPLVSLALYVNLADPDVFQKVAMQEQKQNKTAEVRDMISKIIERLKQNPDDMQGWLMLGRAYLFIQDFNQAEQVFAKLYLLQPENVEVMVNYADILAMTHNGQLSGKAAQLIEKALILAPDNNDVLWMAGMLKVEQGEVLRATDYFKKLAAQLPADSVALQEVEKMLADIKSKQAAAEDRPAAANPLRILVNVELDKQWSDSVSANQTVFIYAQALSGPKMPLAIVRKQVADLPLTVELNDSMAMQANLHLSDFAQVKIIARISKTGNAMTQSGDVLGSSELNLSQPDLSVHVTINQEVK